MQIKIDDTKPETPGRDGGGLTKYGFLGMCALFVVLDLLFAVWLMSSMTGANGRIAAQETELAALEEELASLGGPKSEEQKAGDNADDGEAAPSDAPELAFVKKLLTWDSADSYQEVRGWLKDSCGAGKGSQVLTEFMPKIGADSFGDANMKLKEAEFYQVGEGQYFALCKVSNRIDGNTGTGRVGVSFSMGTDGKISGVSASTLTK